MQRVLAGAGVAARRACEALIEAGRVEVNGVVERTLPVFVDPAKDHITVDGRGIPRAAAVAAAGGGVASGGESGGRSRHVYLVFNKPAKVLVTAAEDDRRTVMDFIDHPGIKSDGNPEGVRVFPVGRLDFHAMGMLILTSDGDLANRLTHARYGVTKTYEALVRANIDEAFAADLERGLNAKQRRAAAEASGEAGGPGGRRRGAGGGAPGPIRVRLVEQREGKSVIEVTLRENGPRTIADMLGEAGLLPQRLVRTAVGPVRLRAVAPGSWRELERGELRALRLAAVGEGPSAPPPPAMRAHRASRPGPDRDPNAGHFEQGGAVRAWEGEAARGERPARPGGSSVGRGRGLAEGRGEVQGRGGSPSRGARRGPGPGGGTARGGRGERGGRGDDRRKEPRR